MFAQRNIYHIPPPNAQLGEDLVIKVSLLDIEKPIKGRKYFFEGIFILQKGIKHKKAIPILKAPNKIGLTDEFKPNLPKGYALPKKNITKTINAVCLFDKTISSRKDLR